MNKKLALLTASLVLIISVGVVVAQESGYFLDISNSNANINTAITNSSVIENITLANGTLNLYINADNISSVTINGINYTAQGSQPAPGEPVVFITYYGENTVPAGIENFPGPWLDILTKRPAPDYYYSFNLTMVNITPINGVGVPLEKALEPLVEKYPMLVPWNESVPNQGISDKLSLRCDTVGFNGRMDKQCLVLYSYSQLSGEEIASLVQDLNAYAAPAIIAWYS
jgi:hypothetical protein